ncbi:MAG TPA: isopeptide-forming domain-containing fimbrial protein, partial [Thermoanaerobaculia bacterium]
MRGRLRSVLRLGVRGYLIASFLASPDPLPAAVNCATPGKDGAGGTLSGVVNTYYPGTANAAAGATLIHVGASRGSATGITAGDLLLVIQMQDAAINSSNTSSYGSG